MADSDSEAFESADEEVEIKKEQKKGETTFESTEAGILHFFLIFQQ